MKFLEFLFGTPSPKMEKILSRDEVFNEDVFSIVTFDHEYEFFTKIQSFPKEDAEELKGLINSEHYKALRKFLLYQVLSFYRDARETKDSNVTVVLNNIGNSFRDFIYKLDSYKEKSHNEPIDPYEVV